MEFRQLQHFIAAAEELNFTQASAKAYISQQALSKSIRMLEEELGVSLFERLPRGLKLTEYGHILLKYSLEISSILLQAHTDIRYRKENSEQNIAVALTAGVEDTFPLHIIFDYQRKHPDQIISTTLNNDCIIEDMLLKETIDFAIIGAKGNRETLQYQSLIKSDTVVLMNESNPLSTRESVCLEELKDEKILFSSTDYNVNKQFLSACNLLGFIPQICHNSAGIGFLLTLASENQGIVFSPSTLDPNLIPTNLRLIKLEDDPHFFHIHIVTKKGRTLSQNASRLIEEMAHLLSKP